jgi:hypothetical protein
VLLEVSRIVCRIERGDTARLYARNTYSKPPSSGRRGPCKPMSTGAGRRQSPSQRAMMFRCISLVPE